ncbi:glycosyl hydrolase 115 family protein [Gilvimarinus sp. SDUM040013]|uniref:Glycosyl hydrolase 115 family protein n=1 Tax=Gilvimarinus gilvus TaxID=3058038 RepID=A0ABU4S3F2_9GAMM|nr:glycosyl hydrolase 115 family protein [Gilvimarinus sp. SDUM040013]MDO3384422.1 glycosyl hydrolase 115 family protein [Gilvimarinus sp. SDUM040013]MDX6851027.1 glycosyl hydrolase 115 family protein [Gilvimarinus sp. SDUM040013]
MKLIKKLSLLSSFLLTLSSANIVLALGNAPFVTDTHSTNAFHLVHAGKTATLLHHSSADPAVTIALTNLQQDIARVSGAQPLMSTHLNDAAKHVVIAGQIGHNPLIDQLIAEGKLKVNAIAQRWEGYVLQTIDQPTSNVDKALVIAGSDRRGVAYGIYEVSEQIGVSPWYWWADVPVKQRENLYVEGDLHFSDYPEVKYRGIFLNDEAPALTGWATEKFGGYNHQFYEKVFELLTRLKANYLWPAMWNNAFNDDDPLNMVRAHEYGIFMGTSHHEPMMRADKEWNRYGEGPWDYARNPDKLFDFWVEGAKRNKPYDSIYTLGMRGQADTPMSDEQNIGLLEKIVADQREILLDVFSDRDITDVPQVWALYKEVQGYYEDGMRVPDDVTLLWADDNWGNIRRLPTPDERTRSGGAGVYYHFDYVGGPRSYRWTNVTPIAKIWEQMNLADAFDAKKIWIVNVGDLKPQEFPMEFFLRMAWQPSDWPQQRLQEFGRLWAEREFGEQHAEHIEQLISGYTRHNGRRKPELMGPDTYSQLNYREADRISSELTGLVESAEALYAALPKEYQSVFFQLVLHPVKATYQINELYNSVAKNRLYAHQGRANTNDFAQRAKDLFNADAELSEQYHTINDGKWNHLMSQTRIGYTHWNNPPANTMPVTYHYQPHNQPDMGVAAEGQAVAWPNTGELQLPEFSPYGETSHYIDIYNRGTKPFEYSAVAAAPWISLSHTAGEVRTQQRIFVSVDWSQAPAGAFNSHVFIKGTGWGGARVQVKGFLPTEKTRAKVTGFVEHNGYISIEAPNFSKRKGAADANWEKIAGHGRTQGSITVLPVTDNSYSDLKQAPWVEYDIFVFSTGDIELTALFAPSLEITPGKKLRYAVAINENAPQVIELLADSSHRAWQEGVRNGVRSSVSTHNVARPGAHKLRVYAIDPGVTLQKLVLDLGGLKESYLGPPQSHFQ